MAFIVLGKIKDNYRVLDTEDLVIEDVSKSRMDSAKKLGLKFHKISALSSQLGIEVDDDYSYRVFLNGSELEVCRGSFPKENDRNILVGTDIHMTEVSLFKDSILISVVCNCWCKYDFEVPMFMLQVVRLPLNKSKLQGYVCLSTDALYICDKSTYVSQYKMSGGDFPQCFIPSKRCSTSLKTGNVLGVDMSQRILNSSPYLIENITSDLNLITT